MVGLLGGVRPSTESKFASASWTIREQLVDGRKIVFCDIGCLNLACNSTISNSDGYHSCPTRAGAVSKVIADCSLLTNLE